MKPKPKYPPREAKTAAPQPALPAPRWRRHALPILIIWLAVLAAYANSFQAGLPLDNRLIVLQDSRIASASPANLTLIFNQEYWYVLPGNGLYRPLTTLSLLFNYAVLGNGKDPAGYHIVNFLLHGVNASLLYLLGWMLFQRRTQAAILAGLWAVHPVLTESVTNVVGRADLLAGLGVLAGLLCYIRAAESEERKIAWLAGACAALTVGIFSKESAIVLVPLAVAYDLIFGAPGQWRKRAMGYAALAAPCLFFLAVRLQVLPDFSNKFPPIDNPLVVAGFWSAKLTAIKVIGKELWLLVWPARLSSDYSYNQIPLFQWRLDRWETWKAFLSLAVCLAAVGIAIRFYRRNRPLAFFIAFFFIALAPTANILMPIGTIMAERLLYLPAVGFAGCLAVVLCRAPGRAAVAAAIAIGLVFSARTFARNFDWKDDVTIWASAAANSPNSNKAHIPPVIDDRDAAVREIDRTFAILSDVPDKWNTPLAYVHGGQIYRLKGDQLAAQHAPGSRAWYEKALATLRQGQRIETASGFLALFDLYQEMGRANLRLEDYPNAAAAFDEACRRSLDPHLFEELAVAYLKMPDLHRAALALMEGLMVDLSNRKVASELADVYRQIDPDGCGKTMAWDCPAVHADYCVASQSLANRLARSGNAAQALATTRQAAAMGCQ